MTERWHRAISGLQILALAAAIAAPAASAQEAAAPADPARVVSVDACVKCHPSEVEVWRRTPHSQTFEQLHRLSAAKEIAAKLGVRSVKYDNRCVACHYTQKIEQGHPLAIAGVSCESCHGAARDWVDLHHDYGPGMTRDSESAEHHQRRVAESIAAGMRNPENVFLVAQSCYRCHTVRDESLVNVGGHNQGSLDFEFVSWSQGMLRHNFLRSQGEVNEASSAERLRVMFVAGMLADLEASLRATAAATQTEAYAINAAKRTARAAARLQSVAMKVDNPQVRSAVEVYAGVELKLGNAPQLNSAADQIAKLGVEFAEQTDGRTLQPLDAFIPKNDRWK